MKVLIWFACVIPAGMIGMFLKEAFGPFGMAAAQVIGIRIAIAWCKSYDERHKSRNRDIDGDNQK